MIKRIIASFFCVAVSYYVGEVLLIGRFISDMTGYMLYEFLFFLFIVFGNIVSQLYVKNFFYRFICVMSIAYASSFFSSHACYFIFWPLDDWLMMFERYPFIVYIVPACLVGLCVGLVYFVLYEFISYIIYVIEGALSRRREALREPG